MNALSESEAKAIVDELGLIGVGILTMRRGGRIVDATEAALQLFDRSLAELTALADISELIAPQDRAVRVESRVRRSRGERTALAYRVEALRPDGSTVPVESVVVPLPGQDFDDPGALSAIVVRDNTGVAERDALLRRYESLVEYTPDGIVLADVVGVGRDRRLVLRSANPAACEIAEFDLNSREGDDLTEIFFGHTDDDHVRRVLAMVGTGRVETFPDLVIDGGERPRRVFRRKVIDLAGNCVGIILDDITSARHADAVRRELLRRMVELVDHERRSIALGIHDDPLQQIAAATLLVEHTRRHAGDDIDRDLAAIRDALRAATRGLRQFVFQLSPPELVETGIDAAIRRASDQLFSSTETMVTIVCDVPDDLPSDILDTAFRIVVEALTNSRKHAAARVISVQVRTVSGGIEFEVADDGGGGVAERPGHLGMGAMRDRAAAVGGWCRVDGTEQGTLVSGWLPSLERPAQPTTDLASMMAELDSAAESLSRQLDSVRESERDAVVRAERARDELALAVELDRVLGEASQQFDLGHVARVACRLIASSTDSACSIRLYDGTALRRIASHHDDVEQLGFLNRWVFADRLGNHSHAMMAFSSGAPTIIDRERSEWIPGDGPIPPPAPYELHTAIIAPLRRGGTNIGVITVARDRNPARLTSTDIGWVGVLGAVIAAHLPAGGRASSQGDGAD